MDDNEKLYEDALDVLAVLDEHECDCGKCYVVGMALIEFVVSYERAQRSDSPA